MNGEKSTTKYTWEKYLYDENVFDWPLRDKCTGMYIGYHSRIIRMERIKLSKFESQMEKM